VRLRGQEPFCSNEITSSGDAHPAANAKHDPTDSGVKGVLFSFGYIVLVALKHFAHVSRVVIHRDELGGRHHVPEVRQCPR